MKLSITILITLISLQLSAQAIISGTVSDAKNNPIEGANVSLDGTYDGATTNAAGAFSFKTAETGTQTLTVSFISFETYLISSDISTLKDLKIALKEDVNSLETVVLSAGTFSAGDNSKISALTRTLLYKISCVF